MKEAKMLEEEKKKLKKENERLKRNLKRLREDTSAYEEIARRELGMVKRGEKKYSFIDR